MTVDEKSAAESLMGLSEQAAQRLVVRRVEAVDSLESGADVERLAVDLI